MNEDLIGYEFEHSGLHGSEWIVQGSDPVLGANYVLLHRKGTDGSQSYDKRVVPAFAVRQHKELTNAADRA